MQRDKTFFTELLLGGSASVASGVFTNPLDCVGILIVLRFAVRSNASLSWTAITIFNFISHFPVTRWKRDFNSKESYRKKASRLSDSNLFCCFANRVLIAFSTRHTGSYQVIYRNIFHAAYLIAKTESFFALQKGNSSKFQLQYIQKFSSNLAACFDRRSSPKQD